MSMLATIGIVVLLWACYRVREHRTLSTFLAAAALYPLGITQLWLTFGFRGTATVSEALPFYFFLFLVVNFPIALFLGSLARRFLDAKAPYWHIAFAGILIGAGISPFHFLLSTSPSTGQQPNLPFVYLIVDALWAALVLPWMLQALLGESRFASSRKFATISALVFVALGIYTIPNVAFRTYGLYAPLGWLEKIGARRALMFGGTEAEKAKLALAHAGDPLILEMLRKDLLDGHYETGYFTGTRMVVERMPGDPEVRQALINQLDASIRAFHGTNTFGDEGTKIVSLCDNLGTTKDVQAVPYLIRAYRLPSDFINIREAAAKALAEIGGPEAAQFASRELAKLHPNLDRNLGDILGQMEDPQVKRAIADFDERGMVFRENRRIKEIPIDSLVQSGNDASLLMRALDPHGAGRDKAVFALIKRRHPDRIKATLAAIQEIYFQGKELRGIDDPELFKALVAKLNLDSKSLDLRIGRLLGDWAPPGSERTLEKLLFRFNLREAADGLGRLGTPEAAKILLRRLAKVTPIEGSFELYLIRGLGITKQPIAEKTLRAYLEKKYERASLISDGSPIYPNDVAARALKELATPKALESIVDYRYQGDPVGVEAWWSH